MMVAMAEGTNKSTPKQEDAARKRMRRSGSLQRTQQRKAWTRRDLGGMTLRHWLPIAGTLLVSLVIALGIWGITWQLEMLENQRAEAERELAERRAQDEALQAYLDQMSQLILDRKLLEAEPGDPVHTLAQARTSAAILRLDAKHNENLTHFLITSDLSVRSKDSARLLRRLMCNSSQRRRSPDRMMHQTLSKGWCRHGSGLLLGLIVRPNRRLVEA
jgi:hypothetical protein